MRVHVSPETFRRLAIPGEEHRLDAPLQATLAVAAALAAWRQDIRSTCPAPDEVPGDVLTGLIAGAAVVNVKMTAAAAGDIARLAARRGIAPELQAALILWASVKHFDPPRPTPPARFAPRRWRVRSDVEAAIATVPANPTAALLGDPSFGTSLTVRAGGRSGGVGVWDG